ncbi:MAG: hypothetical protein JXB23_04060 [Candidatus Aminicenantes bacterium]|nr:hypothetical protein [Candidatus Aminicenantes bacterium]
MDLNPDLTYTIFLLPFAYNPVIPNPKKAISDPSSNENDNYFWKPRDWGEVFTPSNREIKIFEYSKKKEYEKDSLSSEEIFKRIPLDRNIFIKDYPNAHSPSWELQYFMPETNAVLFSRAKWFELRDNTGSPASILPHSKCSKYHLHVDNSVVPLCFYWGRLILFEYPSKISTDGSKDVGEQNFARNGILALKIGFESGSLPNLNHLLCLNEYFRYYKIPFFNHPTYKKRHAIIVGLPGPDESIAPNYKTNSSDLANSYFEMWDRLLALPIITGSEKIDLMPPSWHENAKKQAFASGKADEYSRFSEHSKSSLICRNVPGDCDFSWDVYPDNRAFVWTCAYTYNPLEEDSLPDFSAASAMNDHSSSYNQKLWHALLDVDAIPDPVDAFRYNWLKNRTYTRWAKQGTLYGFNNYSVALFGHPEPFVPFHFETMYFDMGLMLLQSRISLFRISRIVSRDTQKRLDNKNRRDNLMWVERFRRFRGLFASFVNLYHYPLLSTQQQGIEMYELMRKNFDVDAIFTEIKSEIESTHELAELEADKSTETGLNRLTIFGLGIASGALIGQILGMSNIFNDFIRPGHFGYFLRQAVFVILFALIGFIGALIIVNKKK